MRIFVVNDRGTTGGAATAANRINRALMAEGCVLAMTTAPDFPPERSAAHVHYQERAHVNPNDPLQLIARKRLRHLITTYDPPAHLARSLSDFRPDVVHLHNLHGYRDHALGMLEAAIDHGAPIVWTLHDMWALTGGCAYALESTKYATAEGCDASCAQLGCQLLIPAERILAHFERLRGLLARARHLAMIAPSAWLAGCAPPALSDSHALRSISNPLPPSPYAPCDKKTCRELLRIPPTDDPVLLTLALDLRNPVKGVDLLFESLRQMPRRRLQVLAAGDPVELPSLPEGMRVHFLGRQKGDERLALVYNAADIFALPSLAENQPLVVAEAMACGVPVVALPSGGVPEMIDDEQTGWLAKERAPEALAAALGRAFEQRESWPEISRRARQSGSIKFDAEVAGRRYKAIYSAMAAGSPVPSQEELNCR